MTILEVIAKANAEGASVADALVDSAGQIDNKPQDETAALVEKLVRIAQADKTPVEQLAPAMDDRFTEKDCRLLTPAIIERAERLLKKQAQGPKPAGKTPGKAAIPSLPWNVKKDAKDRYWVVGMKDRKETGQEHGPFVTKKEAEAKRKELLQSAPQATETTQAAEEIVPPQASETNLPVTETEETDMAAKTKKTTSKKKAAKASKPAASNGKPRKTKAEKPAKADGPAKVRYERGACFVAGEVLKKHGLAKGITQEMVDECTKAIGRENEHQDWFNLRNAWQAIRAYVGQPADGPK